MNSKIVELKSKRGQILSEAQALLLRGLNTSEQKAEYQKMLADVDIIDGDISTLEKIERTLPKQPAPAAAPAVITNRDSKERRRKVNTAWRSLLLHGYNNTRPEQRDITIATDGTVLIPQEFSKVIIEAQKFYGPIANLVKRIDSDNGRPWKLVNSDDTASTMTYIPETGATAGVEADPTSQSTIPGTDSLVSVIKYSRQELEDAEDLQAFIQSVSGLRVARSVEHALTVGKDNGGNSALPNSPVGGLLANVPTGTTTASLAAGIGYSDLVNLAGSVDHAYYVKGVYMASPSVHNYLLGQKDSTSRPYYNVDPETGLLMINGKPLYVNNAMPAYNVASSPVCLFGDFSRALVYLNGSGVGGMKIRVLTERYADVVEGAALIYTRLGSATLINGSVKALVTAAS